MKDFITGDEAISNSAMGKFQVLFIYD